MGGCGWRLELIAFIAEPAVARRILDHLGLSSLARAKGPGDPDASDPGPDYRAGDPIYDD